MFQLSDFYCRLSAEGLMAPRVRRFGARALFRGPKWFLGCMTHGSCSKGPWKKTTSVCFGTSKINSGCCRDGVQTYMGLIWGLRLLLARTETSTLLCDIGAYLLTYIILVYDTIQVSMLVPLPERRGTSWRDLQDLHKRRGEVAS